MKKIAANHPDKANKRISKLPPEAIEMYYLDNKANFKSEKVIFY